jgi:two-component system phosphate regulon sensor histidine kinase PhoR
VGGAQERVLKAFAQPLGATSDGARLALLVLRDETDIRRAERTRADFLANASHELRTPLASLSGFIETLRGHARTDEGAREKFLGIMQGQAERMSRLIDDLLSLSRIELNEHIAPDGEADLALAVMDVVDSLGPLARERGVRLETDLPEPGVALSIGDRDQIVQVIQNLIDNALKYSPRDSAVRIQMEIGLTAEAAAAPRSTASSRLSLLTPDHGPDIYAVLRVSDSGLGLAREHLPRLTERFYRVEGQKSGERSGTGLGLAIVKHIMNRHRGGMAVESVEGEGATFTVYFPLAANPGHAKLQPSPAVTKLS